MSSPNPIAEPRGFLLSSLQPQGIFAGYRFMLHPPFTKTDPTEKGAVRVLCRFVDCGLLEVLPTQWCLVLAA
jgi:hypothetical protein